MAKRTFNLIALSVAAFIALPALAADEMSIKLVKRPGTSKMKLNEPKIPTTLPEKQVSKVPVETAEVTIYDPAFEIVSGSMLQPMDLAIEAVAKDQQSKADVKAKQSLLIEITQTLNQVESAAALNFQHIEQMSRLNQFQDFVKTNCYDNNSFCDLSYRTNFF